MALKVKYYGKAMYSLNKSIKEMFIVSSLVITNINNIKLNVILNEVFFWLFAW